MACLCHADGSVSSRVPCSLLYSTSSLPLLVVHCNPSPLLTLLPARQTLLGIWRSRPTHRRGTRVGAHLPVCRPSRAVGQPWPVCSRASEGGKCDQTVFACTLENFEWCQLVHTNVCRHRKGGAARQGHWAGQRLTGSYCNMSMKSWTVGNHACCTAWFRLRAWPLPAVTRRVLISITTSTFIEGGA